MVLAAVTPPDITIPGPPDVAPGQDITTPEAFMQVLQNILGWAFAFALIIGVAMLIAAGILYITSAGGAKTKTAVNMMIFAVVGIAVAGFAWAIVNVMQGVFFGEDVTPVTQ